MASVRGVDTKSLTNCPLLTFFQAASPIVEAGEQEN